MESELAALHTLCEQLAAQRKSGEKKERDNAKLKTIISSQDERVSVQ